MRRPRARKPGDTHVLIHVRIQADVFDKVTELAQAENRTISGQMTYLLRLAIEMGDD